MLPSDSLLYDMMLPSDTMLYDVICYLAMLSVLDDSVANVTAALRDSGMYDNTVLIFTTDNGGPVDGFSLNYASNYPLRSAIIYYLSIIYDCLFGVKV